MSTKPSWPATLCEWLGCAGIGLVPGLMSFLTAIFAPERTRQVLLSEFVIVVEVLLWCTVTMIATIAIFISKHNVISELSQKTGVPRLPTSMMLLGNLILLPLVIGQTVFRLGFARSSACVALLLSAVFWEP